MENNKKVTQKGEKEMRLNYQIINQEKNQVKELLVNEANQILEDTFGTSDVSELTEVVLTELQKDEYGKKVTALNKSFEALEKNRKDLKKEIEKPYKDFEKIYKEVITEPLNTVKEHFKSQVDRMKQEELDNKIAGLEEYFNFMVKDTDIENFTFEMLGIKVNASDSDNKLKDQIDKEVERIKNDINVIKTLDNSSLVLSEYKNTLNLATALANAQETLAKMELVDTPEVKEEETADDVFEEVIEEDLTESEYTLKVVGNNKQIRELRKFMEDNNIRYDVIG